ncbi:MAG: MoaD/ThiS family protein, partial [Anaerolineales bacterium]|nr:MoaD/ThiS family protein [Anaerolineales bacterium]
MSKAGSNPVNVMFFATLRSLTGTRRAEIDLSPDASVADLKAAVAERFPDAAPALDGILVSINHNYADETETIPPGAEVALFPPVSGG